MSIKSILVHLADDPAHNLRLDVAFDLADRFDAHITALYITTPSSMPAAISGRGASHAYIAHATEIAHEKSAAIEDEFRKRCESQGHSWEWVCEEGDHLKLLELYARYADIAIVSPSHHHTAEDEVALHLPEHLPLQSSTPVLLVPHGWKRTAIGKNVLIAWKSTREAARTTRSAVPLLQKSEKVTVATVDDERTDWLPGVEIGAYLARHGINVETRLLHGSDSHAGKYLLAACDELGCDLIVVGAYGHSRLRELIFGGTTSYVLKHTKVPLLSMH